MAEYDFLIPTAPGERAFAKLLLERLQKLARWRDCERPTTVRFRWIPASKNRPTNNYHVTVCGNFTELQCLSVDAMYALPHFAAGVIAGGSGDKMSMIPEVIPIAFYKATIEMQQDFDDLALQIERAGLPQPVMNSYFFATTGCGEIDNKTEGMSILSARWLNGDIPAEPVMEHAHTVLELLLKKTMRLQNNKFPFAGMVQKALSERLISDDGAALLIKVKDKRRDSKHRNQPASHEFLSAVMYEIIGVMHNLVAPYRAKF